MPPCADKHITFFWFKNRASERLNRSPFAYLIISFWMLESDQKQITLLLLLKSSMFPLLVLCDPILLESIGSLTRSAHE